MWKLFPVHFFLNHFLFAKSFSLSFPVFITKGTKIKQKWYSFGPSSNSRFLINSVEARTHIYQLFFLILEPNGYNSEFSFGIYQPYYH